MFGFFTVSACADEKVTAITESECENALSSFAVVPTVQQDSSERLEMLAVVNAEQEVEFSEACSRFPGWSERFDAAYADAQKQTSAMTDGGAFENADVIETTE